MGTIGCPGDRLSEPDPIAVHALERKRDGRELTPAEIRTLIASETPDHPVGGV